MSSQLPFPTDQAIVPPLYYDSQNPPYRPTLELPNELLWVRDYISVQISNMAGLFSTLNPARMFLYNTLVYCHFDNDAFREVYRMVCGLLLFRQHRGNLNDVRMAASECVYQVLQVYAAHLCNNYPELMKQLDVNQLQSVRQSTQSFQDLRNMVESEFAFRENERRKRMHEQSSLEMSQHEIDIVHKCKDLYTLTSHDLIQDSHFVHEVLQRQPFNAQQHTGRMVFNPSQTRPLPAPISLQPQVTPMYPPHSPPSQRNNLTRSASSLTPHELQYGLEIPKDPNEIRQITDGYDANYPELGYFPLWHPRYLDWYNARAARCKAASDKKALDDNKKYGTPLPPHLKQEPSMQYPQYPQHYPPQGQPPQGALPHQGYPPQPGYPQPGYPPQQQVPGYHDFRQQPGQMAPGYPQQQLFAPPQQQLFAQQPPTQGMYVPDIPYAREVFRYPNGDRVVQDQYGHQHVQQLIMAPNLSAAMPSQPARSFMQSGAPGATSYEDISPALKSSMGRWQDKPIQQPPVRIAAEPTMTVKQVSSKPSNDNASYFHRGRMPEPAVMAEDTRYEEQLANTRMREIPTAGRNSQVYQDPNVLITSPEEHPADEWANHLISNVCSEEEQTEIRGYAVNPNDARFDSERFPPQAFETKLPFEQESPMTDRPVLKQRTTTPSDFRTRKRLTLNGGNQMDRSQHQIVKFGGTVRYSLAPQFEAVSNSIDRLAIAPATVVKPEPISQMVGREGEDPHEELIEQPEIPMEDYMIYPVALIDPTLDAAMLTSRVCKIEHVRKSPEDKLFRSFSVSCEMLFSDVAIEQYVAALRSAVNFDQLAGRVKQIAGGEFASAAEKQSVQTTLTEIDRKLTDKVNEFLAHKLGVATTITEFTSDISELRAYLVNHYKSEVYGAAFDRFEKEIIASIGVTMEEQDIREMKEILRVNDDIETSYLPFSYSFTHISLTDEELGFNRNDFKDSSVEVNSIDHPSLYNLVQTLQHNKQTKGSPTVTDYLITSDGIRYRLFVNYLNDQIVSIARDVDA